MKHFIFLLILLPLCMYSQQKKKVCVPARTNFMQCCDTTTVIVNVPPAQQNCCIDTVLIKALLTKPGNKEEKSWWDKYGSFVIALIPILLGFLAYRYAIKQMIAKARLEWIYSFRPLVSNYITGSLKSQTALAEVEDAAEKLERISDEFESQSRKTQSLQKKSEDYRNALVNTLVERQKQGKIVKDEEIDKWGKETDIIQKELNKEKVQQENIQKQQDIEKKEFLAYYEKYKIEAFDMYRSLNEVLFHLDPETYGATHKNLDHSIKRLLDYNLEDDEEISINELIKEIRIDIQSVIAEQWQLAGGGKNNSLWKQLWAFNNRKK